MHGLKSHVNVFKVLSCKLNVIFTTPWANSADDKLMTFSSLFIFFIFFLFFFQKMGFDISCKLSPLEMSEPVFWKK